MLWLLLLVAWFCEVQGGPAETLNGPDIQYDQGNVNSLTSGFPPLTKPSETVLDFDEDYAVQQGDLLQPRDRNAVKQLWPEREGGLSVPYKIGGALEGRTGDILKALNMISEKTCISFHERTNESDYLHFELSKGCASYVGFMGGEQPILVGPSCKVGNICHEVLHSLGLLHEHSRLDRDEYITVLFENIASGKGDNFMKKEGNTFSLKYDPESILHYGEKYFSSNGKNTIQTKVGGVKIGQRTYLSDLDVQKLQKLYHCAICAVVLTWMAGAALPELIGFLHFRREIKEPSDIMMRPALFYCLDWLLYPRGILNLRGQIKIRKSKNVCLVVNLCQLYWHQI